MANARKLSIFGTTGGSYELNDYRIHIYPNSQLSGTAAVETTGSENCAVWNITDTEISGIDPDMSIYFRAPVAGNANVGTGICINSGNIHPVVTASGESLENISAGTQISAIYDSGNTAQVYINGTNTTVTGIWKVIGSQIPSLTDLTDTNITSPSGGQNLIYDQATLKWINKTEIYKQSSTPSNPANGDLWIDTDETVANLPVPSQSDAGKFLAVDNNGNYALITIINSENVLY